MRTIERTNEFKRDYRRAFRGLHRATLTADLAGLLAMLAADIPPDSKYRDHELSGRWGGYRECHLKPDLLLIYSKAHAGILRLARLGSHSELF
jgi:mRNA interferase YafQ